MNLDAYKQQRAEIEQSFGALLKQLPNKSEMDALLIDINQAGLGRGLAFDLFKPAATENFTEFYAELPVAIKVTGNYHDLGAFASDVAKMPRIVLLTDIKLDPPRRTACCRWRRWRRPTATSMRRKSPSSARQAPRRNRGASK